MFIAALLLAISLVTHRPIAPPATVKPATQTQPTKQQWLQDVHAALAHSHSYLRRQHGSRLAINVDIDDTAIAATYGGGPVTPTLQLTRLAQRHHIVVLFNTGRGNDGRQRTIHQLKQAGYRVDGLCMRRLGEKVPVGKQRCRSEFEHEGYTLIANIGNNDSDFAGRSAGREFHLPNYGILP